MQLFLKLCILDSVRPQKWKQTDAETLKGETAILAL